MAKAAENVKSGRGRSNLSLEESVKRDLKDWSVTKEVAMDRGAWKLAIHVPKQSVSHKIFMDFTSAYPNFFGTKGIVVVVVGYYEVVKYLYNVSKYFSCMLREIKVVWLMR